MFDTENSAFRNIVPIMLAIPLAIACYVVVMQKPAWREQFNEIVDYTDSRPAYKILFIGNSRTYYNDMPYMVRDIADSAGAEYKVQATMHALPARSFKNHWQNPDVIALLEQKWDHIIVQEQSGAHGIEGRRQNFFHYGEKLIRKAKRSSDKVSLFVGWAYSPALFKGDAGLAQQYHEVIQQDHYKLSKSAGAGMINVGGAWTRQRSKNKKLRLDTDGNHPNIHGSYLAAVSIFKALPEANLYEIAYIPHDIPQKQAEQIILSAESIL